MEWVEASGKSLPEAKEVVLDLLGVAEDDAEFVVLSEPKAGLFGRMRGEARVQARVRPVAPPPKRGRRQRPDRSRNGNASKSAGSGGSGGNSGQRSGNRGDSGGSGRSNGAGGQAVETVGGNGDRPTDTTGSNAGPPNRNRRRRGARSTAAGGGPSTPERNQSPRGTSEESEDNMQESLTLEQQGKAASDFVAGLVREFGLVAEVGHTEVDEETVQVAAVGDDLGLLVGPRGATLAAVQDLTRTFVQRQSENRTDRILVDVGGYREKRTAALRRFTAGIVDEVKNTGEERSLEPMSPADRKVVHDTVNEIDGVETRSDGSEPSRYVVIQPST